MTAYEPPVGPPREPRIEDFPSLEAFGERLAAADVRRWRRGSGFGGPGVLLAAFVGTTGLALTAATGSPVPPFLRAEAPVVRPAPTSVRLSTVRAADPAGGLPWTVRVGSAGDGTRCVTVGQVRGERLGIETAEGRFEPLGPTADAQCGQIADGGAAAHAPVVGLRDVRAVSGRAGRFTVLFGVARPGTDRVRALLPNGRTVVASLAADGSFVALLPGEPRQAQPIVDVRRASAGATVRFDLARTLPDPDPRGRPWKLTAESDLGRGTGNRTVGATNATCFRVSPVPPFVGWDTKMPRACAVPRGTWAAVTRLRSGARGEFGIGRLLRPVDWAGLPTRTLVTIRVPGTRSLPTVRALGRAWALRRVGVAHIGGSRGDAVYMGLLPGAVEPADVQVSVQRGAKAPTAVPVRRRDLRERRGVRP
ncbi:hypothetical protein [Patulibacter americanus]|uniref:hypothetical protein n=1 Tax=Patulibacter americanus TaxID=588672 RepID=UPI0003B5F541|nr:hypothetical protein [Patulibacter americanus]